MGIIVLKTMDATALDEGLTFDDVLLVPGYADFLPHEVDLSSRLTRGLSLAVPVLSAAMDTVTEGPMALAMAAVGGIGVIHRNMPVQRQAEEVAWVKASTFAESLTASRDASGRPLVAAAVGAGDIWERASALLDAGCDLLVIDTAHGHSRNVVEALRLLRRKAPDAEVLVGNIATAEAARLLIEEGACGLKVGIGPGSICTTRIVAGVGVPQMTAIRAVAAEARLHGVPVVADGGIRLPGDLTKAMGAGADTVMLGGLLARATESAAPTLERQGRLWKRYRGMGSLGALQQEGNDRYGRQAPEAGPPVPEGVEGLVPLEGTVAEVLHRIVGGLRKGMGYTGFRTIHDLQRGARFVRITSAAVQEGHPHDIEPLPVA
ncbi:MAG: IMP dehydrogenase [Candidatus Sericytochromatia bacterium]|nr:IMP dehydrogenase [Candidatus Sericytochromatia bacterium]